MKTYEALAQDLSRFERLEDFQKECVADYIECPDVPDCQYDGIYNNYCIECKVKWLESEWE